MKTLVCTRPGELDYQDTAVPASAPGMAILRVRRVGVCGTDLHAFEGVQPYFSYPRILGHELAGELVDARYAPGFTEGETVTIIPYFSCGTCIACRQGKPNACRTLNVFGVHSDGGMREYISVPVSSLVHGEGLGPDALALVEPLSIGAHGVQRAGVATGDNVLIVGAGPIGMACVESARLAGAKTIVMDLNQHRLSICQERLGASAIIDAGSAHVREQMEELTAGEMPSIVIDATGNLAAINNAFQWLAHGGRYILVGLQKGEIRIAHPEFHKREALLASSRNATRADFEKVLHYLQTGVIRTENYITHRAAFDQVKNAFPGWPDPKNGVVKAMIDVSS